MKTVSKKSLNSLKAKCDDARKQLLLLSEHPCRGQIYSYERAGRRYVKWQCCVNGTRRQRTVRAEAMEPLLAGMAAQQEMYARLEEYLDACDEYMAAKIRAAKTDVSVADAKKKHRSPSAKKKHGNTQ